MSNRRMLLSEEGKQILDRVVDSLECERPMAVKIALAKGISISEGPVSEQYSPGKNKWTIPDNIIKDKEFLLFKHLIINEVSTPLTDDDLHKHMLTFIEKGLRKLEDDLENKTSMEDFRLRII
ncbi:hypothetical protein ACFX4Y_10790 [Priestia sp. YIM B13446]|uniref:hypothetical protein n=1 Tax=Priestia TaxID=2800373 RepID=UPI000BFA4CAF|nr:hypothetical protein [Priestia megaterium]RCX25068.1 hypothetical protein DEU47_10381 [Bacillus sp. AG236]MCP1446905.1 hypothetical protein [Priestia megaterium]MDC7721644.1 hypothetical protein [Priestia megaterium]MEB2291988.1 hypothetical protein [Priestia megaterium]PFL01732.1 hypothetical protein COJ01_07130 [Priestia megaterium]